MEDKANVWENLLRATTDIRLSLLRTYDHDTFNAHVERRTRSQVDVAFKLTFDEVLNEQYEWTCKISYAIGSMPSGRTSLFTLCSFLIK